MTPPRDLAAFCLAEFTALHATAPRAVARGRISRDAAETRLRAWLAMACLMGADHPIIAEFMDPGDVIFQRGKPLDEAARRQIAAQELCPRWRDELARAVAKSGNLLTTPENVDRWVALVQLTRALGVSVMARTAAEAARAAESAAADQKGNT